MAISRNKKVDIFNKLTDIFKKSTSVAFVNFKGLTVGEATALRRGLKKEGVGYYVAKKTLIKKALGESKVEGELPNLEGEIAIAFGEDNLAPARGIFAFKKELKEKINFAGGIFEGNFIDKEKITSIANIPDRQVLYGQFANLINSPISRFVIALDQIAKKKESA